MKKFLFSVYSLVCYLIFFATFLYLIGFVENLVVPKTINTGEVMPLALSIPIYIGLMLLFGLQHSIMARQGFKDKWTKIVPLPIERSTYVLFATLAVILLLWFWQPIPYTFWDFSGTTVGYVLMGISFLGWGILLLSTYLINHFDLFGLRQVYFYVKGKEAKPMEFKTPALYKVVRHPLYLGFVMAFWFTPVMTGGHLLFASGMTLYILVGIYYEEKDLIRNFGEKYRQYRQRTAKLIPFTK